MPSVAVHTNLSTVVDAIVAGDRQALAQVTRQVVTRAEDASELLGQLGLIAMHGDQDGHTVLTLGAASVLSRWLIALRHVLGDDPEGLAKGLPLVLQAASAAAPAIQAGHQAQRDYPQALFPSGLPIGTTVSAALSKAVASRDTAAIEQLLFGLYGTGADYRTLSLRIYDAIAYVFQENGHVLQLAARGSQVLDAVEWSDDTPNYIHWLAPHLPQHAQEPEWMATVRTFLSESQHSLQSYRTRLAAPKNAAALPLRELVRGQASTAQVLQGVYDALITNGASARGVGSVLALAAADLVENIGDEKRDAFEQACHGLLLASATRLIYTQVQAVEALPLLFSTAVFINALHQAMPDQFSQSKATKSSTIGGGLLAPALLESLSAQLEAQDLNGALATARRYVQLGHDTYALSGVIGLQVAKTDIAIDQGHTLQIVQAACDEFLSWPKDLTTTNVDVFLHIALQAVVLASR